jgi:hypothetical protein
MTYDYSAPYSESEAQPYCRALILRDLHEVDIVCSAGDLCTPEMPSNPGGIAMIGEPRAGDARSTPRSYQRRKMPETVLVTVTCAACGRTFQRDARQVRRVNARGQRIVCQSPRRCRYHVSRRRGST